MIRKALFVLASLMLLSHPAFPCGMITHGDVSERGASFFECSDFPDYEDWLSAHSDALQAGSHFPDWGYYKGLNPESDFAHSMTFMRAAGQYVHDHYPKPWDTHAKKLAVFVLGIVSHNEADDAFHDRSAARKGFLEVMSRQDFHGSYLLSHGVGDVGGEAVLVHGYDMDYVSGSWWAPYADIAALYNQLGYPNVTVGQVRSNLFLSFLVSRAELLTFDFLSPLASVVSPFLFEQFDDFFIGGADDMTYWVTRDWSMAVDWMENGVTDQVASGPVPERNENVEHFRSMAQAGLALIKSGELTITEEEVDGGIRLTAKVDPRGIFLALPKAADEEPFLSTSLIDSKEDYSYLGSSFSVGDFDNDGKEDLAVGAPGFCLKGRRQLGAVYVLSNDSLNGLSEKWNLSDRPADQELYGEAIYGRFGWALATVDLNRDGVDDLAVSAPTLGAESLAYQGKIFVYFGSGSAGLSETADLVIQTEDNYTNLGYSLAGGDLDGDGFADLAAGNPFDYRGGEHAGSVAVFASSQDFQPGAELDISDAARLLTGAKDYDWYGYRVGVEDLGGQGAYLLVSAPSFDAGGRQSVGRLYGYPAAQLFSGGKTVPSGFTVTGKKQFDQTGFSFGAFEPYRDGRTWLAVGSPTADGKGEQMAGRVSLIPVNLLAGDLEISEISPAVALEGAEAYARFGWAIQTADVNNDGYRDLWVSEPYRNTGGGAVGGAVYLWAATSAFSTGSVTDIEEDADLVHANPDGYSMLGNAAATLDIDGDGYPETLFGARRHSASARLAGGVFVAWAPGPLPLQMAPAAAAPGETYEFQITGKRFLRENLAVRFRNDGGGFSAASFSGVTENSIRFVYTVPADAEEGVYDLVVTTDLGTGILEEALTVLAVENPVDDDDDDSPGDDDPSAGSTGSPQAGSGQATLDDDNDDDEGCGC